MLRRLPLGKYSSINIAIWGGILLCHCAASSYAGLLSVRFFLGAFEATVTPAFVILTSVWYVTLPPFPTDTFPGIKLTLLGDGTDN